MTTAAPIIFLPAAGDRPAEPAPFLMTEQEAARFLRLESADAYRALARYRRGGLRVVQIGKNVRYPLRDLVAFIEKQQEANPR